MRKKFQGSPAAGSAEKEFGQRKTDAACAGQAASVFHRVPGMAQVLRVKVPSRVFTAKCSEPQAEDSNV